MTAALGGSEWSASRPGRTLPRGKTRYPFYRRLGGPQGRSGRAENLVPTGILSRTVQPVVSRYTDWATRPLCILSVISNNHRSFQCLSGLHLPHPHPVYFTVKPSFVLHSSYCLWPMSFVTQCVSAVGCVAYRATIRKPRGSWKTVFIRLNNDRTYSARGRSF